MGAQLERTGKLSQAELAFIELNGQHYEKTYGIARIGGRILGLLMIAAAPITSEEIGATLKVSHGSISTNLRLLAVLGLIEKVTLPADRCDYYRFSPTAWDEILSKRMKCIHELRDLAYLGLDELKPQGAVRQRFEQMATWIEIADRKYEEMLAEWKEYTDQSKGQQLANRESLQNEGTGI